MSDAFAELSPPSNETDARPDVPRWDNLDGWYLTKAQAAEVERLRVAASILPQLVDALDVARLYINTDAPTAGGRLTASSVIAHALRSAAAVTDGTGDTP